MAYLVKCDELAGCGKTYPADLLSCPHCGAMFALSGPAPLNPREWGYDIETYPNAFTATFIHIHTGHCVQFEISSRRNQLQEITQFLYGLRDTKARGVGFNNIGFDYPVIHRGILGNPHATYETIYRYAMQIIDDGKINQSFAHTVWDNDQLFPQLDLYKINHFDNKAKSTSLKALEFCMHSRNIEDLPFPVGKWLTDDEIDVLLKYNRHDVQETCKFYVRNLESIAFREELSVKYDRNFVNHNDTKIGKDYFIMELERRGVQCYDKSTGRRLPRQTPRDSIALSDVIFPYVRFERPEFNAVKNWLLKQTITVTKGAFNDFEPTEELRQYMDHSILWAQEGGKRKRLSKITVADGDVEAGNLHVIVDGFKFGLGTGGLHGSIDKTIVVSTDDDQIVDVDVASFYPNLGIKNRVFPEHLSTAFCDIYLDVYNDRARHKKGSAINNMLKLALNGVYGDSNNIHSPFYDPLYTMKITINGQLLLCMLVEQLIKIPSLKMIQANTDGLTFLCPKIYLGHMRAVCKWWEQLTCLQLEEALYSKMAIRDVNSYLSVKSKGGVKRIGAYAYETAEENNSTRELPYHKDWSARVVAMAAEAALVRGEDIRTFIVNHADNYDFLLRVKVPRSNSLVMRYAEFEVDLPLQNITRFYIARSGGSLTKIAPPAGEPGTWKRKAKISDEFYSAVMRELSSNLDESCIDSAGIPHDERIHTKNKSKHGIVETGFCVGWLTAECNDLVNFDRANLNYEYYIAEAEKLVLPLMNK